MDSPNANGVKQTEKPKTKLQLKMEKAKKDKELKDIALAKQKEIDDKERHEQEKILQEQEFERIEIEKLAQEKLEQLKLEDEKKKSLDLEKAKVAAEELEIKSSKQSNDTIENQYSTMYGDDVFSEYSKPNQINVNDDEDSDSNDNTKGNSRKARVSNKARRKLAKELEAKEREEEYRVSLMKASIEGAQFAVSQSAINPDDPQWQNSLDIIIPSLNISAHNKELFVNAELHIVHGRRYGLVGPNGAGKSTLLKMIAYGELKIPPRVDYLYVEQEVLADDTPAVDAVLKADKERWLLLQEEKEILAEIEKVGANEVLDTRLGDVYEALSLINASAAESKARRILFGLGFDAEMQVRPTKYFSGGWRMRISLARALFIEPTLLMLDEPTNHLDLNAVIWLDDYLQRWKKTLLIVSHDQDFLNSVCQEIIHLDDKKLVIYKGNYDTFKQQEEIKRQQQLEEWLNQEKRIRAMKAKGLTKENAEKAQLKNKSREKGARSNKKDEKAKASSGGAESGESQVELIKRPREYTVTFTFQSVDLINPPIIQVRDVSFRYKENLPWLFKNLSFGLDMTSRVCIVGPNGSGKSTLLKLITSDLTPPDGMVIRNPRLRLGVYNQHFVDKLPMEEDPVTYLRRLFNEETYQTCRNLLGKFGLEGHAHTIPIRDLSGGQKARVVFAELSLMAPHILFLDEPTNNLDIESIDALCIAMREYTGGVILVSHDARLIETTNCQLWVVEDQNVTPWTEGFDHYREHLLKKLEEQLSVIIPGGGEREKKSS
eukprot:gene18145-23799_t